MEQLSHKLSLWLHYIAQIVLGLMMVVITMDILGRWLLRKPITGAVDFVTVGLSCVIFLGLAYTHLKGEHISIDFLVDKLTIKGQKLFDVVINVGTALFMIIISMSILLHVQRLYYSKTVTGDLNIPVYLFGIVAFIGVLTYAIVALYVSLKSYKELRYK